MLAMSKQLAAFVQGQAQTPAAYLKVQLPTADGANVASSLVLPNMTSLKLSRNEEASTDSAGFTLVDNMGVYSSLKSNSPYGIAFQPGEIDKKFLIYLGYKGNVNPGKPTFAKDVQSLLLLFTGFVETDQQDLSPGDTIKNVSLLDLSKQFRFQVYDTFPHPLYGNQTLPQYDPTYDLTCPTGDGKNWVCPGKMFTQSSTDKIYGDTHINVAVYVDTTGGSSPSSTPVNPSTQPWTFDYRNGTVVFGTAIPLTSKVSVAGNPTYMAPETMVRKILVEKAQWSPNFIVTDPSNILLGRYEADNQPAWDCMMQIAGITNPRLMPWTLTVDGNGVVHFQESKMDNPPVHTFVDERDMLTCSLVNTSRQLRTVVTADALITTAQGDQPIRSIAYDYQAIVSKYGLTEPLPIDSKLLLNLRNLSPTQALSILNQITQSALATSSRPIFTIQTDVWPNFAYEIGDTVRVRSKRTGVDSYCSIKGIDISVDPQSGAKQTLRLDEYIETINYIVGVPNGVQANATAQGATVAPPQTPIIGAVRMGSPQLTRYPFLNSQYNNDEVTGKPIIPTWNPNDSYMAFDVFLNSMPSTTVAGATTQPPPYQYDKTHRPPGHVFAHRFEIDGTDYWQQDNDGSGYTIRVGNDNVYYRYPTGQTFNGTQAVWVPPNNTIGAALGALQGYTGVASSVYLWMWWYLCLDSNQGVGKMYRLVQRVNPAQDAALQTVPATGGLWVTNHWTGAPVPSATAGVTKLYGNMAVGITDYTAPPTGFVGANVRGDGVNYGVAYGSDAPSSMVYAGYEKTTRGHLCILAANAVGQSQFLRVPFHLLL